MQKKELNTNGTAERELLISVISLFTAVVLLIFKTKNQRNEKRKYKKFFKKAFKLFSDKLENNSKKEQSKPVETAIKVEKAMIIDL